MNQQDVEKFVTELDNVEREENFGYLFFFVGDNHIVPFMTIAQSDNEYDSVSQLDREGVFRINIGVGRETFEALLAGSSSENVDYSVLNVFMPHPDYAKQHFVCILNPAQGNVEVTKKLIVEAHGIAAARLQRRTGG